MVSVDLPRLDLIREQQALTCRRRPSLISRVDLEYCLTRRNIDPAVLIDQSVYLNSHLRKLTSRKKSLEKKKSRPADRTTSIIVHLGRKL
jgi:hypothetical protein